MRLCGGLKDSGGVSGFQIHLDQASKLKSEKVSRKEIDAPREVRGMGWCMGG